MKTSHDVFAGADPPEQHLDRIITEPAPLVPSRLPVRLDQLFQEWSLPAAVSHLHNSLDCSLK
jgi:hypothetical protein